MKIGFRLSVEAENDILDIARNGALLFGVAQARKYHNELFSVFQLLSQYPKMARLRHEITPPIRIHPFRAHLIVYREESDHSILIIRIRHGHEDWAGEAF
jgi:toxin ParE1/3/4